MILLFEDNLGRQYLKKDMPEKFVFKYTNKSEGEALRLLVFDKTDNIRRRIDPNTFAISEADFGLEGLVAYSDYYVDNLGNIIVGYAYVVPEHRKRGISKEMYKYYLEITKEESTLNLGNITSAILNLIKKDNYKDSSVAIVYGNILA
jgi:predicted GNAT family acetyltransferase